MIFVDTNVFVYAVGKPHQKKGPAQEFFVRANRDDTLLCTSAEVLQELAHVYLKVGRREAFDAAIALAKRMKVEVWPLEEADVSLARQLYDEFPSISSRDLCYLASCHRRGVDRIQTFDDALNKAQVRVLGR